ncbi:hypothetical protein HN587_03545 [Candidatus Woesearchaeota archaeon]|jgi:hypothetical protein|nr:hypothetical protein [Candidatus Woesearchaeota archaeon]
MGTELLELARKLSQAILTQYMFANRDVRTTDYLQSQRDITPILEDAGFDSLLDPNLTLKLMQEGIFYQPLEKQVGHVVIISAYLGTVEEVQENYHICKLDGNFNGIDFYDGHTNKDPTIIKILPLRILINKTSIEQAFEGLEPQKDTAELTKKYMGEVLQTPDLRVHPDTQRLKDYLKNC